MPAPAFRRGRLPAAVAFLAACCAVAVPPSVPADGPKDNVAENVRPIPPKGIDVPEADLKELKAGLAELKTELDALPAALAGKPALLELIPDAEVYHKAVRYAVEYGEFFNPKEVSNAKGMLKDGLDRAKELKAGTPSWPTATGVVVRGYRSTIDGSAQPYVLIVPPNYDPKGTARHRLDFWWHGRGETLSEVSFLQPRKAPFGEFVPEGAFVLHPYGRYSNANKFAGEVDTFECLAHARQHYRIDDNRLVARGFSMGGAACWQFAVHFPTVWCAANPGAGFAETPEFLNVFQNEKVEPTWYEKKLWHMYNATDYAQNIFNLPTVAYSGEDDRQKQAADVMAREMKKVGLELTHIIGPKTGHKYEPGAKKVVAEKIDAIVAKGKPVEPRPEIKFVTYTLQYNWCGWLSVTGLERHWSPAEVHGKFADGKCVLTTKGVTSLSVTLPVPKNAGAPTVTIDGKPVEAKWHSVTLSGTADFVKTADGWQPAPQAAPGLAKRQYLQGPIDDAFLSRFVMVKPTGKPLNDKVGGWAAGELKHAVEHWRRHFRGDAIVKDDAAITDADIKDANLVLWGDPSSNAVLAKIADKLPVKWTASGVVVGDKTYDAGTHVPVLIYPNPLNPTKYVVLNSGFTFREYDYLNNARQVPKLPDYAVVDVTTPPNSRYPGKVVRAGFFGEKWQLQPNDGE